MTQHSNVLLITTDTQRCDSLRCMGGDWAVSPNLDRLAREGVLFEQAHTASPVCGPARASLFTGVHTPIHGATENNLPAHQTLTPITSLLDAAGYRNLMVGKTHFQRPATGFHVLHELHGEKGASGDDFYAHHLARHGYPRASRHPNPVPEHLFCDAFLTDTMIGELTDHLRLCRDQPFFAFLSLLSPHAPYDPPGRWAHLYDEATLPPLNYLPGEVDHLPQAERDLVLFGRGMDQRAFPDGRTPDMDYIDAIRRRYYGLCAYCDHQVGRIVEHLDRSGLRESTLVIFTSDHGTTMYDHGFENKHSFLDASWRVPMILSQPGTLPCGLRASLASWMDIPATILARAGVEWSPVQGFDLVGPLAQNRPSPRACVSAVIYETAAVTTCRWKLEYALNDGKGRLIDRHGDPIEQTNLFDSPAHRTLRDRILVALLHWRAELTDLEDLHHRNGPGGPVAQHVASLIARRTGLDAEIRLQSALRGVDD